MADNDEEMMVKFIEKLTNPEGKLIPGILDHVHDQVERSISGLKTKNEELLSEVKATRAERDQIAALLKSSGVTAPAETGDVWLTRAQASDPAAYRKARAEAERRGTTLKIEGRHASPA